MSRSPNTAEEEDTMYDTTRDAVRAVLKADPSLDPETRNRMLEALSGVSSGKTKENGETRIIRRNEAARLLARSPRAVDYLAAAGHLQKVTFPGHSRSAGFRMSSVQALINGGVQ